MPTTGTFLRVIAAAFALGAMPFCGAAQDVDSRTMALLFDTVAGSPTATPGVDPAAIARANSALQAGRLVAAQRVTTPETNIVDAYARALLLGTRAPQVLPELAEVRNAAVRGDREATASAISRLYTKLGRNQPDAASMGRLVDAVTAAGGSEGPEETARRRFETPGQTIEITDAKGAGLFTVEVTSAAPDGTAQRTVVTAERTVRPNAAGTDLETRAVPIKACTITTADSAKRRPLLNGTWRGADLGEWDVAGAGEAITLTSRRPGEPTMTYTGTYKLGRIQASHQIAAPAEAGGHLPGWVRAGLVGKVSYVVRLDDCGDARLEGTWESRHVTYSPDYEVIRRIHDPYDRPLKLSRRARGMAALP